MKRISKRSAKLLGKTLALGGRLVVGRLHVMEQREGQRLCKHGQLASSSLIVCQGKHGCQRAIPSNLGCDTNAVQLPP